MFRVALKGILCRAHIAKTLNKYFIDLYICVCMSCVQRCGWVFGWLSQSRHQLKHKQFSFVLLIMAPEQIQLHLFCQSITAMHSTIYSNRIAYHKQKPTRDSSRNVIYCIVLSLSPCLLHNSKYFTLFLLIYYQNAIRFVYTQIKQWRHDSFRSFFFWSSSSSSSRRIVYK